MRKFFTLLWLLFPVAVLYYHFNEGQNQIAREKAHDHVMAIRELERESRQRDMTQIFIETPYRNQAMLTDLIDTLSPTTRLCIASDLTGQNQAIIQQPAATWRKSAHVAPAKPALFLLLAK